MSHRKPTAIIYVDGMNLYKQTIQGHPEIKWLNIYTLCESMIPTHSITLIRYFTARVKREANNISSPDRQYAYLQALQSLGSILTIHFGRMVSSDRLYPKSPLEYQANGELNLSKVRITREKGTDVALASHMVLDAAKMAADLYLLLSNDSDFEPTLKMLKNDLNAEVALISPVLRPAMSLVETKPTFIKIIRYPALADSQFPNQVLYKGKLYRRPETWVKNETPYC